MDEGVIEYGQGIEFDCQIMGLTAVDQKSGYLAVKVKIPISSEDSSGAAELAGILTTHLGNIARGTLRFSKIKKRDEELSKQPDLDDLEDPA